MNIYISGVGGQGTGMLSEILVRAIDSAGFNFRAVDTHGLAQRGGTVVSQIRYGDEVFTPLIANGDADLVIGLELHEAFRSMEIFLKKSGTLICYDTIWEPLNVRLGEEKKITHKEIADYCSLHDINLFFEFDKEFVDIRMQNIVLLAGLINGNLLKGITVDHIEMAMSEILTGNNLEQNLKVFRKNLD
ncbi:MAG: 2-oxoacid:acceptor oxidoreductase family protein [Spirochaetaceae bacterium]|jgi:indolepyruvate ferredoxin oxidoreductase beta subunit|nr:2-oxoacid:acceptor oxidoreductase family protein [Spirochaetaceae bacterium]